MVYNIIGVDRVLADDRNKHQLSMSGYIENDNNNSMIQKQMVLCTTSIYYFLFLLYIL